MLAQPPLLLTIASFLLAIGVLVVVHEWGHYAVGRLFGVHAEVFSVGFGREVAGRTDARGTRWRLSWLPLGGYVRFAGDMNPASAQMSGTGQPGTFQSAGLWQRALIVAAGPAINVVFAIGVYAAIIGVLGLPSSPAVVTTVEAGSAAAAAGFRSGDRVEAIDSSTVDDFEQLTSYVRLRPGRAMSFRVERGGSELTLTATPRASMLADRFGNETEVGRLGIGGSPAFQDVAFWRLPVTATVFAWKQLTVLVDAIGQLIRGERSLDDLGGPVKIGKVAGETASLGLLPFALLLAALSLNLAFINLLPIPMLDGGHLLFYAVEAVRGRPAHPAVMEWAFRGGLALVLTFFVFVTVNDVASLLG